MQNITSIFSSCADLLFWVNLRHPLGPCEWMKCWWQGLGLGPQHQNLQGKAPNHKTARAQLKGNDGPEKGKLGGEWMQRMGLRGKPYSRETHQSATSSQNKEIKKLFGGLFGNYIAHWWAGNKPEDGTGKFHDIFCPLISFSVKSLLSISSLFFHFVFHPILWLLHRQKLPAITGLQILPVGNRGWSSQDFVTDSS